ncbi:MAG: DUF817 domain-containing protein [Actinomycetales bacterium]|nr:MAG: DUF817 domain-containing protein [Actinomycetales bacterium]
MLETRIDAVATRWLEHAPSRGVRSFVVELLVFGLKQAWACVFGALLLAAVIAARLWYPDDADLARNDALVLVAVAIQVAMVSLRLESRRELATILLFHVVGTVMEIFKTGVGSWEYAEGGVLHVGAVPLFTGFMYGAVGSYLARVMRLFDLRFTRYPPLWATAPLAVAIYVNFFSHHYVVDLRWWLVAAVVLLYGPCRMHVRVLRARFWMPVTMAFLLVAVFIWFAENIGTLTGTWTYPDQADGWHLVSVSKLVAWFLLMNLSVVLVTIAHPPRRPDGPEVSPVP